MPDLPISAARPTHFSGGACLPVGCGHHGLMLGILGKAGALCLKYRTLCQQRNLSFFRKSAALLRRWASASGLRGCVASCPWPSWPRGPTFLARRCTPSNQAMPHARWAPTSACWRCSACRATSIGLPPTTPWGASCRTSVWSLTREAGRRGGSSRRPSGLGLDPSRDVDPRDGVR